MRIIHRRTHVKSKLLFSLDDNNHVMKHVCAAVFLVAAHCTVRRKSDDAFRLVNSSACSHISASIKTDWACAHIMHHPIIYFRQNFNNYFDISVNLLWILNDCAQRIGFYFVRQPHPIKYLYSKNKKMKCIFNVNGMQYVVVAAPILLGETNCEWTFEKKISFN